MPFPMSTCIVDIVDIVDIVGIVDIVDIWSGKMKKLLLVWCNAYVQC